MGTVGCSFDITSLGQGIFVNINASNFGGIFKWFRIYMMDDLLYDVRMGEKGLLGWRCCVFWFVLVKGFGFELGRILDGWVMRQRMRIWHPT